MQIEGTEEILSREKGYPLLLEDITAIEWVIYLTVSVVEVACVEEVVEVVVVAVDDVLLFDRWSRPFTKGALLKKGEREK